MAGPNVQLRPPCLFLGNRNDVESLYCACDLTVLPSLFEATPNVLLESMACGVPIVGTDASDNAVLAPDGRVGLIVPLGDEGRMAEAISRILDDDEHREGMGIEARRWVERSIPPPGSPRRPLPTRSL